MPMESQLICPCRPTDLPQNKAEPDEASCSCAPKAWANAVQMGSGRFRESRASSKQYHKVKLASTMVRVLGASYHVGSTIGAYGY